MSETIESLQIEIEASSKTAVSGIDALTSSLEKLRAATKGGVGLSSISKNIREIGTATNSINSNSVTNITGLTKAIQLLGSTKISSSIASQIGAISTALQGADFSGGKAKMESLVDALSPLATLSKTNLSSYVTNLKKLPETFAELNKIDMNALTAKVQELATAFKPLGDEMQKVANGFSAFPNKIQKLLNATNQIPGANKQAAASFTDLFHKMKVGIQTIKAVGRTIWSAVENSMDYVENVNLFAVAMGDATESAMAYAESVSALMGIDPSEWIRAQGIFQTLATGFGVASDRATVMSQNLTQLGYDLASLYNMDTETALLKLKSGLAGELEPLRDIGYDLSQAKLEATALELGITKSVSAMTQAEKAQLRYYAIMTQVTTAHGDMANTLTDPANQMRVLKSEIGKTTREIGNAFIPVLQAILPYAIAVTKVIGELAKSIASLMGYKEEDPTERVKENTSSVQENLEGAQEEAKKLKSYMLGIDELNVLNPTEGTGENTSGWLDFELPTYEFLPENLQSQINDIVKKMKEWLGITEDIDSWSELLDTRLGDILTTVGAIATGIAAWKVTKGFVDAIITLKTLLTTPSYTIAISAVLTIAGLVLTADGLKDAVEDGLDGYNFGEIVGGGLLTVGASAVLGSKIAVWITTAFEGSAVAGAITKMGITLGGKTAAAVGASFFSAIAAIIVGIPSYFVGIYDACVEGIDWLNSALIGVGATVAGAGIGALIGMLGGPVGAGIGALIGLAVGLITDFSIWLFQKFDEVAAWFNNLPAIVKVAIVALGTVLTGGILPLILGVVAFIKKWEDVKTFLSGIGTWFYDHVVAPIVNFFAPIFEAVFSIVDLIFTKVSEIVVGVGKAIWSIVTKITEIFLKIVEIFVALGKAFYTYVIQPIIDNLTWCANWIYDHIFAPVGSFVNDWIITPIYNAIVWVRDKAIAIFKTVWTAVVTFVTDLFKAVINGVLTVVENKINNFIKLLNGAITLINQIPGVNITKVELLSIPRLAEGGFPEQGQMFIAREAGAEMVGNIGRKTAVANNDQIVSGIAGGVAEANEEQNALIREQNSLLRALLEKDSGVYLDGKRLTNSVEKYQRERGRVLITGGAL